LAARRDADLGALPRGAHEAVRRGARAARGSRRPGGGRMRGAVLTLALLALPAVALAQDRATQFVAVSGPTHESVPGGPLLVGAYGLVWLILFGLVLRTAMVQSRAAKDLERLERLLEQKAPKPEEKKVEEKKKEAAQEETA